MLSSSCVSLAFAAAVIFRPFLMDPKNVPQLLLPPQAPPRPRVPPSRLQDQKAVLLHLARGRRALQELGGPDSFAVMASVDELLRLARSLCASDPSTAVTAAEEALGLHESLRALEHRAHVQTLVDLHVALAINNLQND
jgi:hypothetical protein